MSTAAMATPLPRAWRAGARSILPWLVPLVLFGALDVALTHLGLSVVPGARELNPLPALAWAGGLWALIALKLAGLGLLLALALPLVRDYPRAVRAILAFWSIVYAIVDVHSLLLLSRAGVFA